MCIVKEIKNVVLSVLLCLMCSTLCGCAIRLTKTRPFSAEELESYNAPIVFLGSSDGRYFITLDNPDEYEVNIYTGEKVKVAGDKVLGNHLILTDDKSMGCSEGDELLFGGISFSPVLVWDTKEYKVKRFYEGTMSGSRVQLSNDKKYVMFVRNNSDEPNQVLCLNVEEETMCEVYETEDWIYDILWW